jgi:subtilisin family serine protease
MVQRWRARVLGAGVLGAALLAAPAGTGLAEEATTTATARAGERAVTLITGDKVFVREAGDRAGVRIVPAKGRERIGFTTRGDAEHLYVVPLDAQRLLAADKLDRRLFDVRELIRSRYDDAGRSNVPLIVAHRGKAKLGKPVRIAKSRAASGWERLRTDPAISKIWLDGLRKPLLDQSVPQVGAPQAWQAGLTGKGTTVAVLDTGIDATHPDLAGQITGAKNFTQSDPGDEIGHGTHVASTIAGTGAASGGKYKGVAPDAKLLDGKVCEDYGCEESAILAGMEWAAAEQGADVINVSLGGADSPGLDPLEAAVNTLTEQTGALFVIAAGNAAPWATECRVASPASADAALAVGAVDKQDELAGFSCTGPRVGDGALKPDITAPGVDIAAARAAGTEMGEPVGDQYVRASGTSMATPHVAGAAAILAQRHPDWTAANLKGALMSSAKPIAGQTSYQQGAGRVDVARAVTQQVIGQPGALSYEKQSWPHDDDAPEAKQLQYRNLGDESVRFDLTATMLGPDGKPAPDGALRLSATTLEIPASGTASVTVTSNTRHNGPDGVYSGRITATAGDLTVTTPVAVEKEVESYDLTIRAVGRNGETPPAYSAALLALDSDLVAETKETDGEWNVRVPRGRYHLNSYIHTRIGEDDYESAWLVQPLLVVDRELTLTVDGRTAKPMSARIEGASEIALGTVDYTREDFQFGTFFPLNRLYTAQIGPDAPADEMTSWLTLQARADDAPALYLLTPYVQGRFFNGYDKTFRDSELAKVTHRQLSQGLGPHAGRLSFGFPPRSYFSSAVGFTFHLPSTVTTYHTGGGTQWMNDFAEGEDTGEEFIGEASFTSPIRVYREGRRYRETWNNAVFNPSMQPWAGEPVAVLARNGDVIQTAMAQRSDGAGNVGGARIEEGNSTLYRNGEEVARTGYPGYGRIPVPAEAATYRLETWSTRPAGARFATRVESAWTFRSAHVPEGPDTIEGWKPLPGWAVRYTPAVDDRNHVTRKGLHLLPMTAESVPGAKVGRLGTPKLEYSLDDGKSWKKAVVLPAGAGYQWVALIPATADAEYVSLRVKASDSNGNQVEQTVTRAYGLVRQ